MDKGLILELKQDEAIVLTSNGEFRSVKRSAEDQWQIGQEVEMPIPAVRRSFFGKRSISSIAIATSVLILFVAVLYFYPFGADQEAIAFVSVDINPSIEIGVDDELKAISLIGLNAEGEQLIHHLDRWRHLALSEVTFLVIQQAKEEGYLQDRQEVLVVTSFIEEEDETKYTPYVDQAIQELEERFATEDSETVDRDEMVRIHSLKASSQTREEAKQQGISAGKYSIYLGIKEFGIDLDLEQFKGMSISDLAKELNGFGHVLSNFLSENENPGDHDQPAQTSGSDDEQNEEQNEERNEEQTKEHDIPATLELEPSVPGLDHESDQKEVDVMSSFETEKGQDDQDRGDHVRGDQPLSVAHDVYVGQTKKAEEHGGQRKPKIIKNPRLNEGS